MTEVALSEHDETTLSGFDPNTQKEVARVIDLLENDWFREHNRVDLILIEDGKKIWSLSVGRIWLAFVEENDGSITVVHLTLLSRFREP